jgi:hypothetical protein
MNTAPNVTLQHALRHEPEIDGLRLGVSQHDRRRAAPQAFERRGIPFSPRLEIVDRRNQVAVRWQTL